MGKAEQRALKAYPEDIEKFVDVNGMKSVVDNNSWQRTIFLKGYHQAEKDLELTWEDMHIIAIIEDKLIHELCLNDQSLPQTQEFYKEVLKRFKTIKERKQ